MRESAPAYLPNKHIWGHSLLLQARKSSKRQRDGEGSDAMEKKVRRSSDDDTANTLGKKEHISADLHSTPELEETEEPTKMGFFTDQEFSKLPLSDSMHGALSKLGFVRTTKIQVSHNLLC